MMMPDIRWRAARMCSNRTDIWRPRTTPGRPRSLRTQPLSTALPLIRIEVLGVSAGAVLPNLAMLLCPLGLSLAGSCCG